MRSTAGRRYQRITTAFQDVTQLTNTGIGEDTAISLVLSRPSRGGLGFNAGYTWMDSNNGFDGSSSRASRTGSSIRPRGDIFEAEESTSSWENEHRWYINAFYNFPTGPVTHSLGLFWNAESGRPFSILMGGDPNTDGFTTNDLLYIPTGPDQVILQGFTWDQFLSYLGSQGISGTGRIVERNEAVGPWTRRLDFHYGLEVSIWRLRPQFTVDVLNLLNVFDEEDGVVKTVPFGTTTPITTSVDAATGKTVYRQNFTNAITNVGSPYPTFDVLSRWQARLGVRLSF